MKIPFLTLGLCLVSLFPSQSCRASGCSGKLEGVSVTEQGSGRRVVHINVFAEENHRQYKTFIEALAPITFVSSPGTTRRPIRFRRPSSIFDLEFAPRYGLDIQVESKDDAWTVFGHIARIHGSVRKWIVSPYTPREDFGRFVAGPLLGYYDQGVLRLEFATHSRVTSCGEDVEASAAPAALLEGLIRSAELAIDNTAVELFEYFVSR